jgi:hypothetical protein
LGLLLQEFEAVNRPGTSHKSFILLDKLTVRPHNVAPHKQV